MVFYIQNDIIDEASKCEANQACLARNKDVVCKIISTIGEDTLICSGQNDKCPYQELMDARLKCTCPVRKEIYKKYDV
jgi:hypothetical protein